jgi:hypothetical protein
MVVESLTTPRTCYCLSRQVQLTLLPSHTHTPTPTPPPAFTNTHVHIHLLGYSRFAPAFAERGWEDPSDLVIEPVSASELTSLLEGVGAKRPQLVSGCRQCAPPPLSVVVRHLYGCCHGCWGRIHQQLLLVSEGTLRLCSYIDR